MKQFILILFVISIKVYADWAPAPNSPSGYFLDIIESNGIFYAAASGSGVYRSTDGMASWENIKGNLTGNSLQVDQLMFYQNALYAATTDGIYKTTNNGMLWESRNTGIQIGGGALYIFAYSIYNDNGILYTGTYTGIYRSTNNGDSWNVTNISGAHVDVVRFHKFNNALYGGRESINTPSLYKSTDNGLNWFTVDIWNNFPLGVICFYNENNSLYVGTGHGVWITTNDGANWQSRLNGLSLDPYNTSIIKYGNTMLTSLKFGGSGVYKSTDNGLNWTNAGQGLPFLSRIDKLIINNGYVYAISSGGIYRRLLDEIVVGVSHISGELPEQFRLYQNYPNPFNPSTKIIFTVPPFGEDGSREVKVSLQIFNSIGQQITTLVSGQVLPGTYEAEWNASDFPSGIYYFRLSSGDFSSVIRAVLVR